MPPVNRPVTPLATRRLLAAALVLAGAAVYANSFSGVFLFDDERGIVKQPWLADPSRFWGQLLHDRRPTVWLSLGLNHAVGGLDVWGYHLFNVAVHLLAALTLYGVVHRTLLTKRLSQRQTHTAAWAAAAVALLWVVHPLQTQAVTYVIQRGESLMGLFYLLTLYCVVRGAASPRSRFWYAGAVVSCLLGMGSKAVMITAPIMVLLYDRVFLSRSLRDLLRRRWGLYVGLAATWGLLITSGVARGVLHPEPGRIATVGFGYKGFSPVAYLLTQPGVLLHYLRLSFWPDPLCIDDGWPAAKTAGAVVGPGLVIVGLLIATLWGLWRRPPLGFLGAWFFLILAPTSSFIPIRDAAFEHRMYLPLAAVITLSLAGAAWSSGRLGAFLSLSPSRMRRMHVACVAVAATGFGYRTVIRNRDYHSESGMWADVLRQHPQNVRAHLNFGRTLVEQARIEEALQHYRYALKRVPDDAMAHQDAGIALAKLGRLTEAVEHYHEALRLRPRYGIARYNLAGVLLQQGKVDEAIAQYTRSLRIRPNHFLTHKGLANALSQKGRYDEAIRHYREALRGRPDDAEVHAGLGVALSKLGRTDKALVQFTEALRLDPVDPMMHYNLGNVLFEQERFEEAVDQYVKALRIRADLPEVHNNLAGALFRLDRTEEAVSHYVEALRLDPGFRDAVNSLAVVLAAQGRIDEAMAAYRDVKSMRVVCFKAHVIVGDGCRRRDDRAGAAAAYRAALRINPRNADVRERLDAVLGAHR